MSKARNLAGGLVLAVLLVAVAGTSFAYGRAGSMMGEGSMMGGDMMGGGGMMGSSGEEKPFDLRFIDEMTVHHQGAISSSGHMISDSERPELRQLARNIEKSQSEQIERMRAWRDAWYPDGGQASSMLMGGGMMGGSMQEKMGGDTTDEMFLRMMIPHHQAAVDMAEEALEEADHSALEDLAHEIIAEQSAEIELMEGYLEK